MDTSYIPEFITIARDVIVSVAAIVTGITAVVGLRVWRHQLRGTTKYQLSKKILENSFALRDAVQTARNPFMLSVELSQRTPHETESPNESITKAQAQAYAKRLEAVDKAKSALQIAEFEALALWGEDETTDVHTLLGRAYELYGAYNSFFQLLLQQRKEEIEIKIQEEKRMILFGTDSERDEFWKKVEDDIARIEERFRKHLK